MDKILERLAKVRRTKDGFKARCPIHLDSTPSLFISEKDGRILLHCFSGCSTEEIVKSINLEMSDLFSEDSKKMTAFAPKGKKYNSLEDIYNSFNDIEGKYLYNWPDEEPVALQLRYKVDGKKTFCTFHKSGEHWYTGKGDGLLPLYNANAIKDSKSVMIVEGEKVVDLLSEYGIPATTSLGGSQNAHNADWTLLRNKPSIVIWRDFDDPGLYYQNSVDSILRNLNLNLRKVEVEKFVKEKGDDLEQFIATLDGSKDSIRKKIYACVPKLDIVTPVSYLNEHLSKVRDGKIKNLEVEFFPLLTKTVRMFKPGSQSVIVSAGGVGKSLFLSRTSDEWVLNGKVKVARLMLESPMSFHLTRVLAQQAKRLDVLEEEFHYDNPEESKRIVQEYFDILNKVGDTITTSDSGIKRKITEWDANGIVRWMESKAPDHDVLIIDPVSIALGESPWLTSIMLTKKAEELMSKHPQLCIIWVQHTAESQSGGNVGGISGGKAWNRYSSAILEMVMLEDPELFEIMKHDGEIIEKQISVFFKVKKCRNGSANGHKIAVYLDLNDLSYKEYGKILRKIK